jgi:hypothetical protein
MHDWTSLEIAKLVASLLTPIAVAIIGYFISSRLKSLDHRQWRSQKLIEKRLSVYDDLVPDLNRLLCYFTYVGEWRDVSPKDIVKLKRQIDRKTHLNAPLFSSDFHASIEKFLHHCFQTYNDWGHDAKLKTSFGRRKESAPQFWQPEWEQCFAIEDTPQDVIKSAYKHAVEAIDRDIGVRDNATLPPAARSPTEIR